MIEIKDIEIYDNGIVKINFQDDESMLINKVYYMDAILTGWDEMDVGVKR